MSGPRRLLTCLAGLALMCLVSGRPSAQEGAGAAPTFAFDIPAEPIDAALASVSHTTRIQLLSDSGLIAGRSGNAVVGRMTVQEAMTRLLAKTGLRARFTAGGAIVITPAAAADMMLEPLYVQAPPILEHGPDARVMAYVALVQHDLDAAAQADPKLAAGAYSIRLRIWLDPSGRVVRSEVIRGSGHADLDAAFSATIQNARVSEAPPDVLPQPLRIEFRVR